MKVAFLTTVPLSLRFLAGHVQFLQQRGAEICVISSPGPALDAFAAEHLVEAIGIEMPRRVSPLQDAVALCQLIRELRRLRPDVVHAHTPKAGLLGMLAAAIARTPIKLYHLHGLPMLTAKGIKRRILRLCDVAACWIADEVFCVSRSLKQVVEAMGICKGCKLVVLANGTIDGVDAEHQFNPTRFSVNDRALLRHSLQIPNSAQVVGFVGRIVGDKGIRELLEAFGALGDDFPNLHLLIVGAFERHQPLGREALATLENNARIHMVEFVADPAPYFSLMDVLAFPTYREGFGLVAAEASSMEVPVVTTQIPGCVDSVCDRVTGTLVPTRDAQSLAKAISAYLRDSECRRRHGRAGRNRVLRDFQPEQVRQALWRRYLWWMNAESSGSHGRSWPLTLFRRRIWGNVTEARSVCTYQHFGKRFLDLMISLPMFFVTLPLLAIVASMACWRLGRPILFWQERPGLHAKPFWMPKFRTMTDERDAQGELLPDVLRMTRLGRFLRSTSLDELPELWNVLRGDMSLVGPRPLLMEYLGHYSPEQARRHEAKPGITGWAQVNGRNAISWEEKFKHDVWYVDHQSLALDLKIVCRTVVTWLSRKGVSANDHATMPRFDGSTTVVVYRDQVA